MRGDGVVTRRTSLSLAVSLAVVGSATIASAQGLPPAPPPPPTGASEAQPPPPALPQAPPAPPPMGQPPVGPQPLPQTGAGMVPPGYPPAMAMFGPSRLPYDEGDPIPPGYEIKTQPRMRMAMTGMALFAPFYGLSVLFAGTYLGNEDRTAKMYAPLLVPVIGPFITIGTADTEVGTLFLLLDGIGQATGATLFLTGMLSDEKYLARRRTGLDVRPEVFVGPRSAALRWQF